MSCPTSNHDNEAELMADHWYKMYVKVDEENKKLKEQVLKLSRIDLVGQNGNGGEHYDETT